MLKRITTIFIIAALSLTLCMAIPNTATAAVAPRLSSVSITGLFLGNNPNSTNALDWENETSKLSGPVLGNRTATLPSNKAYVKIRLVRMGGLSTEGYWMDGIRWVAFRHIAYLDENGQAISQGTAYGYEEEYVFAIDQNRDESQIRVFCYDGAIPQIEINRYVNITWQNDRPAAPAAPVFIYNDAANPGKGVLTGVDATM